MTKEMLLEAQKLAMKRFEELKSQAMVQMTFELEDKLECADLNLWEIAYNLEAIEHTGIKEVTCFILPID